MWPIQESPSQQEGAGFSPVATAAERGRSGTNGGQTKLSTSQREGDRAALTPDASNIAGSSSIEAARRLLISTQQVVRKNKLQYPDCRSRDDLSSCCSVETTTAAALRQELAREETKVIGGNEFDENSLQVKSIRTPIGSRQVGDGNTTLTGVNKQITSIISNSNSSSSSANRRFMIDDHKSWSARRKEISSQLSRNVKRTILGKPSTSCEESNVSDWVDSLNYIAKTVSVENNNNDINLEDFNQTSGAKTSSKLAAKLTKTDKSSKQQGGDSSQQKKQQQQQAEEKQTGDKRSRLRTEAEEVDGNESATDESSGQQRRQGGGDDNNRRDTRKGEDQVAAKGGKVPTFGLTPHKLTRLPYFSYYGKARNVDLIDSADRATATNRRGTFDKLESASSAGSNSVSSSQRSLSSLASDSRSKIPTVGSSGARYKQRVPLERPSSAAAAATTPSSSGGRRFLSYSNISNLFPSKLMNIDTQGRASRLASSGAPLNRHNSITTTNKGQQSSRNRSLNSLSTLSPISPTSGSGGGGGVDSTARMRRQNSSGYGLNGGGQSAAAAQVAPVAGGGKYTRPASVAGGPMSRQQRSPSATSLHYPRGGSGGGGGGGGGSAGLSPYGPPAQVPLPPIDPDCPVHGYWPATSKSQQHLASDQWIDQADLLYDPYPAPPFMRDPYENPARAQLYSPGGGGGYLHQSRAPVNNSSSSNKRNQHLNGQAYYNNISRFSVYHSPSMGDGQRSSLAPASEQVRRILGYQPHARPVHLHPQWAYSRPFIHLLGGASARSPSPIDLDDLDANGQPMIRPRFEVYNQLQDAQAIRAVDFHPSGEVYAVGSNSRTLRICAYPADYELRHFNPVEHEAQSPRVLFKFLQLHRGSIYCVSFNSQGQLLATGSNDQTVQIVRYNATTHSPDGDEYRLTMHDGTVRDLCFIDDQTSGSSLLLSAGGGDNKIYVTDCDTITPYQSMAGHTQPVMALHHWGGANFVSASQDRTLRFWDLRTRACTSIVSAPPAAAVSGQNGNGTAKQSSGWSAGPGAPVCSVKVDPSGRMMASGHSDSVCMLYDIRGARIIQAFKPHDDEIRTVSFSPKSYYLLTGSYDGRIVLSDLQGDLTQQLPQCCVAESDDKIVQSKWHPSDFTFVTTSADKTATLWALPAE